MEQKTQKLIKSLYVVEQETQEDKFKDSLNYIIRLCVKYK